jgi:hypothetical protein
MTGSITFEMATDAALLQTMCNLPEGLDQAAANHHRMEGARLFLNILMTIGDPPKPPPEPDNNGLKY